MSTSTARTAAVVASMHLPYPVTADTTDTEIAEYAESAVEYVTEAAADYPEDLHQADMDRQGSLHNDYSSPCLICLTYDVTDAVTALVAYLTAERNAALAAQA